MKYIQWNKLEQAQIPEGDDKVMVTPAGPFHMSDLMNQFNFWVGHTNFPLTSEFCKIINPMPAEQKQRRYVEGIEAFAQMTPYRFVIAVGKMFNEEQVKTDISNLIRDEPDEIQELKAQLSYYKDWAIYVLPNGEINYTSCNDKDFEQTRQTYYELKHDMGGQIITPYD